jgi:transposase
VSSFDSELKWYNAAVRDRLQVDTKIVFDKFHVMRHIIGAMDHVRRREQRAPSAGGRGFSSRGFAAPARAG